MNGYQNHTPNPDQHPTATTKQRPKSFVEILLKRRWQLIGCLIIVNAIALASLYYSEPRFESVAQIQVPAESSTDNGLPGILGMKKSSKILTQCELLKSHKILALIAERTGMIEDSSLYNSGDLEKLREQIRIHHLAGSDLINVIGMASTPEQAARIANAAVDVFIEMNNQSYQEENEHIAGQIKEQIAEVDRQIADKEDTLREFRRNNQMAHDVAFVKEAKDRLTELEKKIADGRLQKIEIQKRADNLRRMLTGESDLNPTDPAAVAIQKDPIVAELSDKLRDLRQEETRLARVYLPGHKLLRKTRTAVEDTRARLLTRRQKLLESLYHETLEELKTLEDQEAAFREMFEDQKLRTLELTQKYQVYEKNVNDIAALNHRRNDYVNHLQRFTLEQKMNNRQVELVDAAQVPTRPSGLDKEHRAAIILLLGLTLSLLFAVTSEKLSESSEQPDMKPGFGIPMGDGSWSAWPVPFFAGPMTGTAVSPAGTTENTWSAKAASLLGRVGRIELGGANRDDNAFAARCRIVQTDQRSEQASAFREIAARLLGRFGDTQQSVVVTSIGRQSGKTTCAVNLGLLLAQSGRKVLLVDMNPQDAAVYRVFRTDTDKPDVSAVLADPRLLEEAVQQTDIMNLNVINSYNEDKWLHQTTTNALIELDRKLSRRYDWIIYDTGSLYSQLTCNLLQAVGKAINIVSLTERSHAGSQSDVIEKIEHSGALSVGSIENIPLAADAATHTDSAQRRYAPTY